MFGDSEQHQPSFLHGIEFGQPWQIGFAGVDAQLLEQRRHLAAVVCLVVEHLHYTHGERQLDELVETAGTRRPADHW